VHGIHGDPKARLANGVEVDEVAQRIEVGAPRVQCIGDSGVIAPDVLGLVDAGDLGLDLACDVGESGTGVPGDELHAHVLRWVMARREHEGPQGQSVGDGMSDSRCRSRSPGHSRGDPIASEDTGCLRCKVGGEGSGIVPDQHLFPIGWLLRKLLAHQQIGDRLNYHSEVAEGELAGAQGSPSIGSELDDGHLSGFPSP